MARSKRRKDLRKLDPDSSEYWNELLRREGLTMGAGRDPRVVYRGASSDLEKVEARITSDLFCGDGKRVKPTGAKPE